MSIECRSARGIRAGGRERERERENGERFFFPSLSSSSSSSSAVRPRPPVALSRLWAGVVDSFGAVKSPESVCATAGEEEEEGFFAPSSHHAAGALG